MEIRILSDPQGNTRIETISALEDLWHDYVFFRDQAVELGKSASSATNQLIARRFSRAALLFLLCYFEGVVNSWLRETLGETIWLLHERKPLDAKVRELKKQLASRPGKPKLKEPKKLRDMLAHLKPGDDGTVHDQINSQVLSAAEKQIVRWFTTVEEVSSLRRHPDTRAESRRFTSDLGTPVAGSEGWTGSDEGS